MTKIKTVFFFEDYIKNMYSGRWDGDVKMWNDVSFALGCDGFCMIDISTDLRGQYFKPPTLPEFIFEYFTKLEDLEKKYPKAKWVFLEAPRMLGRQKISFTWLDEFKHPNKGDIFYVFGSDSASTNLITSRENKTWVSFKMFKGQSMWAVTSMAIVMYDRYIKSGV